MKSYSTIAGVQDAMTQWWFGHNAVAFFLTSGFLGLLYYFLPKRVERPIYSYRLSTFEGSLMAIRTVNGLSHYTDWTIGHVRAGAMGCVALITFGSIYALAPVLWRRETMYSWKAVE